MNDLRRWMDVLCEAAFKAPKTLYHGTKPKLLDKIRRQGLTAATDTSWTAFGQGVYLALTIEAARQYGSLVFAVKVSQLDEHSLVPDDHELQYELSDAGEDDAPEEDDEDRPGGIHEATWLDSLRLVGQCQYLADIPASALKVVPPGYERRGKPPEYHWRVDFAFDDGSRDHRVFTSADEAWARQQAELWFDIALRHERPDKPTITGITRMGRT